MIEVEPVRVIAPFCSLVLMIGCASAPAAREEPPIARAQPAIVASEPQPEEEPTTEPEATPMSAEEFDRQWNEWRRTSSSQQQTQASGVCGRAMNCCEAYVVEMNRLSSATGGATVLQADQMCAGVAAARSMGGQDTTCQTIIDAFRGALTQAQLTVPAACQ